MATRWRPKQTTGIRSVAGENTRRKLVVQDDLPSRCAADSGGSDPGMAVIVNTRHQVGSCGQKSDICSRSLMTDDKENLKKIKEAKNRQPVTDQHSLSCRRKSFREVLTRDSGNRRLGADPGNSRLGTDPGNIRLGADPGNGRLGADPGNSRLGADPGNSRLGADPGNGRLGADPVCSETSQVSPKHRIHTTSSSRKSRPLTEARSSEIVDLHLLAFHPFSHQSDNANPRRTDPEKSGSARCRSKNKTIIFDNKTPAKFSRTCTEQMLAQEEIANKEIKLVNKTTNSQVMHKLSTPGRLHNGQIGDRKTMADGWSRNEQDGAQTDSPVLQIKKVRTVPQQNVNSPANKTCTRTTHLSKDSWAEQLLPRYSSKVCSRTMASREHIDDKHKGELRGDLKVMKSTMNMTPSASRKTRAKKECLPLMSSQDGIQCSVPGRQVSDSKESPQDLQEFARKHVFDSSESPQTVPLFSRGHVSDRNKSPQNDQEFCKKEISIEPYYETDSSLETSASHSLSDVQIAFNIESTPPKSTSDMNNEDMNFRSPAAGEQASERTACKIVSKSENHGAEIISQLQESSDARFLQLAFQDDENMREITTEEENYNFRSKKHCQKLEIDKSEANIMYHGQLSDNNKVEKRSQELMCDVSNMHHVQNNNSKAENSFQRQDSDRNIGKNLSQDSENDVANVSIICLDVERDTSRVQSVNICLDVENDTSRVQSVSPELEGDNSKVKKTCQELDSDNCKVKNECQELKSDNNKVQNVCLELENDESTIKKVCQELEDDNRKFQDVCQELESDNTEFKNDNSKFQNVSQELEDDNRKCQDVCQELESDNTEFKNNNSKFQNVCQELEDDNKKCQDICQELESDNTEFKNNNSKFQNVCQELDTDKGNVQNVCLELEADDNVDNSCQENDTAWQTQGLWKPLKSKKDQSNQQGIDIAMWKRTGLLNKILDKADFNLDSLASLIPQLEEDCTGIISPLDFKVLNFPFRDIGILMGRQEENDFYDDKLEKALKESEQLLDELRMLTGDGMDSLLNQCAGSVEKVDLAEPGVHKSVAGCKKDLKMFMA